MADRRAPVFGTETNPRPGVLWRVQQSRARPLVWLRGTFVRSTLRRYLGRDKGAIGVPGEDTTLLGALKA